MISIHLLVLNSCLAAAVCFGFFAGRLWMPDEDMEPEEEETVKIREKRVEKTGSGWSVGSPAAGQATVRQDGPEAEVVVRPVEGKMYAPAGGKIMKLYPLGNAFRFHTEFGAELFIQVGDTEDEMLGRYYRPRVVQNEIVNTGKLLLEFDRTGLEAEGVLPEIRIRVEHFTYGSDVIATAEGPVKAGEEVLWLQDVTEYVESRHEKRNVSGKASYSANRTIIRRSEVPD